MLFSADSMAKGESVPTYLRLFQNNISFKYRNFNYQNQIQANSPNIKVCNMINLSNDRIRRLTEILERYTQNKLKENKCRRSIAFKIIQLELPIFWKTV
jgi:hypothetical protein